MPGLQRLLIGQSEDFGCAGLLDFCALTPSELILRR